MRAKTINEDFTHLKSKTKEEIQQALKDELGDFYEEYLTMFTVGDLKKFLEKIPDEVLVGKSGHYGEFHPMSEHNFFRTTARLTQGGMDPDRGTKINVPILDIWTPDIGGEPD